MTRIKALIFAGFTVCAGTMFACGSETEGAPPPAPPPQPNLGDGTPEITPSGEVCSEATGQYIATREPSNVLFLYDRSGSMHIKLPNNATRWEEAKTGFFDLLSSLPPSTGAGLMLFPQGDAPVNTYCRIDASINDVDCDDTWPEPTGAARCNPGSYAADVPSALLNPTQVTAMKNKVLASDASFYWGTPLASALKAAIAAQKASTLPGAKSVILLTDGNPTSCADSGITNDISHVVDAATTGLQGTLVRTFVIGLVDSARQAAKAENLSPIAVAGGTKRVAGCEADNSCFYKLTDANFAADLKEVFKEISTQAFDCTFNLPQQTAGTDPSLITVQLAKGGASQAVARDPAHSNGWDYLPNGTQIQLYGQACADMKDESAKLNIVLGCKPPAPPEPTKPTK